MPRAAAMLLLSLVAGFLPIFPAPRANAGKLDDIKARGKLLVGVTESSPRFSYRDGAKGIVGYDIVFFDTYDAAFAALADSRVDAFADKMLVLWFAQKSGRAADFALIEDYRLPRTAGFSLKKDEPQFRGFVDRTLLDLEASGQAKKIFDSWFAPLCRDFRIQPD